MLSVESVLTDLRKSMLRGQPLHLDEGGSDFINKYLYRIRSAALCKTPKDALHFLTAVLANARRARPPNGCLFDHSFAVGQLEVWISEAREAIIEFELTSAIPTVSYPSGSNGMQRGREPSHERAPKLSERRP